MRPSKDEYYLDIASVVASRSTCLRRQYGAIIVKDDEIVSTGYNGSERGAENCCDVGVCWREAHNIPHGTMYEKCVSVHAENNALRSAGRAAKGATLYLAGWENGICMNNPEPCEMCRRMIKNAGIARVITIASANKADAACRKCYWFKEATDTCELYDISNVSSKSVANALYCGSLVFNSWADETT